MFQHSSGGDINELMEAVEGCIQKIIEDTTPKATIRIFPNQTLWLDTNVQDALRTCTTAYNIVLITSNMDAYKATVCGIRSAVNEVKHG